LFNLGAGRLLYPREWWGTRCMRLGVLSPVWTSAENIASTGFRAPDRPARNGSLYWLRCPAQYVRWSAVVNSQRNFTFTDKMNMRTAVTQQRMCGSNRWRQIATSCKRTGDSNSTAALWFRPLFSLLLRLLWPKNILLI
jgi:hypothetical protein